MVMQVCRVDFVILYIGRFSGISNIPEFPPAKGPETFLGMVVHSMEYADMDFAAAQVLVRGKQVTVVRFQKHAMDIAMECSTENGVENPCTIYHTGMNTRTFRITFLGEFPLHIFSSIASQSCWFISLVKDFSLVSWLHFFHLCFLKETGSCLVSIVPEGFYEVVDKGSIKFKKAPSFGFCKEGILIVGMHSSLNSKTSDNRILREHLKSSQFGDEVPMASRASGRHIQATRN
ncbi:hypothetical protein RHMOL_Rhmol11G0179600 [Rhododendron molle]|uniref:Uncharacterized protein n=1 Tax=Rhododendron molle TaxID=49168 RepID=A0ACC0LT96_RHOML|nr:hypothetical protein RHMOL_Rhmol11G0179600 [Rhododendron molle]